MSDKIVRLSVTCKINLAASTKLAKFYLFFLCQILKANYKTPPIFLKSMNHPKPFIKCLVTYLYIFKNSPDFQLGIAFDILP